MTAPDSPAERARLWGAPDEASGRVGAEGVQLAEWHLLAGVGAMLANGPVSAAELAGIRSGSDASLAFLRGMIADGLLPDPQRYLAGMLSQLYPVIRRGCDPLRAELTGCEFLGDLTSAVPAGRVAGDGLRPMLDDLVAGVEACRTRQALAVLRILAVVAEPAVRPAAHAAADRLAASGVEDSTWSGEIGAPAVGECCGYIDTAGGQGEPGSPADPPGLPAGGRPARPGLLRLPTGSRPVGAGTGAGTSALPGGRRPGKDRARLPAAAAAPGGTAASR